MLWIFRSTYFVNSGKLWYKYTKTSDDAKNIIVNIITAFVMDIDLSFSSLISGKHVKSSMTVTEIELSYGVEQIGIGIPIELQLYNIYV